MTVASSGASFSASDSGAGNSLVVPQRDLGFVEQLQNHHLVWHQSPASSEQPQSHRLRDQLDDRQLVLKLRPIQASFVQCLLLDLSLAALALRTNLFPPTLH
jgi:hypothetical protein